MESSKELFSLMYSGPVFILGIFWLFFRKHEYKRLQIIRVLIDIAVFSILVHQSRLPGTLYC